MSAKKIRKTKGQNAAPATEILKLKPGQKFSDILMDTKMITEELYITPRALQHHRSKGNLSFTKLFGKVYLLRSEIAEMLSAGLVHRRKPLDK